MVFKTEEEGNKCNRCEKSLKRWVDPGEIPEELQDLTFVEQMLLAIILPEMTIHRLSAGGQYGYT